MHKEDFSTLATVQVAKPRYIANKLMDQCRFIDVRDMSEWNLVNIPGSIHINQECLINQVTQTLPDTLEQIIVYCAAGKRSSTAAQTLVELGYRNITVIEGGIEAWIREKLPTSSALII